MSPDHSPEGGPSWPDPAAFLGILAFAVIVIGAFHISGDDVATMPVGLGWLFAAWRSRLLEENEAVSFVH
jgi:hypothetical protein